MFQSKFSIFGLSKEFLENDCTMTKGANKGGFFVKLIRDENGCYNIKDKEFSIKCVFDEKILSGNKKINKNELDCKLIFLSFNLFKKI